MRERVSYSAYLFYKFKQHKDDPGYPPDWGEAVTHAQVVDQTRRMVEQYGFGSIKLEGRRSNWISRSRRCATSARRSPGIRCALTPMAAGRLPRRAG